MSKLRVISIIQWDGEAMVVSRRFDPWRRVGQLMEGVELAAQREMDELVLLDVTAHRQGRSIDAALVAQVVARCPVPLAVGGGITSVDQAARLIAAGADKVVVGSAMWDGVNALATAFGSQAIVAGIDAILSNERYYAVRRTGSTGLELSAPPVSPASIARAAFDDGAGELLVQDALRDGSMHGLDERLLRGVVEAIGDSVPIVFAGGAAGPACFMRAFDAGASGVAAGALWQFTGTTPASIKCHLAARGYAVRIT